MAKISLENQVIWDIWQSTITYGASLGLATYPIRLKVVELSDYWNVLYENKDFYIPSQKG
jgi:hypothetical protein